MVTHLEGSAVRDASGTVFEICGTMRDITSAQLIEAALLQSESRLAEAQLLANFGFWEADSNGRIWCTPQMYRIFGLDPSVHSPSVELALTRIHPDDVDSLTRSLRSAIKDESAVMMSCRIVWPSGEIRFVSGQAKPARDAEGAVYLLGTAQDVTESVLARRTLDQVEAQFRAAVEASFDAILLLRTHLEEDRPTDFVIGEMNRNAERMLGVSRDDVIGATLSKVLPRFERDGALARYLLVVSENAPVDVELFQSGEDGNPQWVHEQVVPIPGGIAVTRADITSRKLAEERLRDSELFNQRITRSTPDWVFVYDLSLDRMTYANRDPLRVLGYSQEEISNMGPDGYFRLVHPEDYHAVAEFRGVTLKEDEVRELTYRIRAANGELHWVATHIVPFQLNADGEPVQILGTTRDVTPQKLAEERLHSQMRFLNDAQNELQRRQGELETLNQRLAMLATRDGLTGLHNHRALQDRLSEEIARADRTGRPLTLLMADVDRFKNYNDRHGHPAGDVVLREIATVLATCARATDFVARYGGEEFALLLPDSHASDGALLGERIRQKLGSATFGEEKVTASFGCAEYIRGTMTKADLIQEADKALYRAKHDGRDCVRVADPNGEDRS